MQLIELRNEVLSHGFDPTQFGSQRVTLFLNDGYQLICSRVDYYIDEAVQDFNTVTGTASYALPADFGRIRALRDTTRTLEMQAVTLRQIDRSPTRSGPPLFYALDGANFHLYPTPDATTYPLEARYWKTPTPLVNDTDVPILPSRWHFLLWVYATAQSYKAEDDSEKGTAWMQDFSNGLAMFAADVKFANDDTPTQAADMWRAGSGLSGKGWSIYGSTWG